jgi:hypothetical protein
MSLLGKTERALLEMSPYCRPVFVGGLIGTILGALIQWLR